MHLHVPAGELQLVTQLIIWAAEGYKVLQPLSHVLRSLVRQLRSRQAGQEGQQGARLR